MQGSRQGTGVRLGGSGPSPYCALILWGGKAYWAKEEPRGRSDLQEGKPLAILAHRRIASSFYAGERLLVQGRGTGGDPDVISTRLDQRTGTGCHAEAETGRRKASENATQPNAE